MRDAGARDGGATDAATPDAEIADAAQPDAGQPDAGNNDAGQPDAGNNDAGQPDAGNNDAGQPDAGQPDAGNNDAGSPPRLYAVYQDQLVFIGTSSGTATVIGPTNLAGINRMGSDCDGNIFGIYDNPGTPKIVGIDVCTGQATHLSNTSIPGNYIDDLDCNPGTHQLYASVSANGNYPGDSNAEHIVALDPYTGTSTSVGNITGGLVDADLLLLTLPTPIGLDGDANANILYFYDLDPQTLVSANVRSNSPRSSRLAVHEGVVYGLGASGSINGQIVIVDPSIPNATSIGGAFTPSLVGGLASGRGCN